MHRVAIRGLNFRLVHETIFFLFCVCVCMYVYVFLIIAPGAAEAVNIFDSKEIWPIAQYHNALLGSPLGQNIRRALDENYTTGSYITLRLSCLHQYKCIHMKLYIVYFIYVCNETKIFAREKYFASVLRLLINHDT